MMRERGTAQGTGGRSLARVAVALLCVLGSSALAQSAPSAVPAPVGIKMGDGRLHPFLDVDGRYDSLVGFYPAVVGGPLVASSDVIVHVRPGLNFALDSSSTLVNFGGNLEYLWYTGLLFAGDKSLSRFQGGANLATAFNREGAVEFQLGDSLTRSDRTQNPAAGVGILSLYNLASMAAPIHPGGRALEITPKVSWGIELFDPLVTGTVQGCTGATDLTCNPSLVGQMNYSNLTFGLSNRWKFLPKTALVLNGSFDWRTYLANQTANPSAMVLQVQTGLVGLLTPHISVTATAGYGGNFAAALNTFVANAEVAYLFGSNSRVNLGYARTLQPVPVFGTFTDDRGYLGARVGLLGSRLILNGTLGLDYVAFANNSGRNDLSIVGTFSPTFDVASWFQIGAFYTGSYRQVLSGTSTAVQTMNYTRHEATLRLTFRY